MKCCVQTERELTVSSDTLLSLVNAVCAVRRDSVLVDVDETFEVKIFAPFPILSR